MDGRQLVLVRVMVHRENALLHSTRARVMACRVALWRMVKPHAWWRFGATGARDSALDSVRHIAARVLWRRAGAWHGKPIGYG